MQYIRLKETNPEYDPFLFEKYQHVYEGGKEFLAHAGRYLVRPYRQPEQIFKERLARAFYICYSGAIIDYFACGLFSKDPEITVKKKSTGEVIGKATDYEDPFWRDFFKDCDDCGVDFQSFLKDRFIRMLVDGVSYALISLPTVDDETVASIQTKYDQNALGVQNRAFLVPVDAKEVIACEKNDRGEFDWVNIYYTKSIRASIEDTRNQILREWTVIDREKSRIFSVVHEEKDEPKDEDNIPERSMSFHSTPGKVPLVSFRVSPGMWIMNKICSIQLAHFNGTNGTAWSRAMSNFAMMWVRSNDKPEVVGEAYWFQMKGETDQMGFAEPSGGTIAISMEHDDRLKDEMYRTVDQMSLATPSTGQAPNRASGESKAWDYASTETMLKGFGKQQRHNQAAVLNRVAEARGDDLLFEVKGYDHFNIRPLREFLEERGFVKGFQIPSRTLEKTVNRQIAARITEGEDEPLRAQIFEEIERDEGYERLLTRDPGEENDKELDL